MARNKIILLSLAAGLVLTLICFGVTYRGTETLHACPDSVAYPCYPSYSVSGGFPLQSAYEADSNVPLLAWYFLETNFWINFALWSVISYILLTGYNYAFIKKSQSGQVAKQ